MYKKNMREYIDSQNAKKNQNFEEYLKENIFICKRDIICVRGTFLKHSPVFLESDDEGRIRRVFDATDWGDEEDYRFNCFTGFSDCFSDVLNEKNHIDFSNFSEYFAFDKELSFVYTDMIKTFCELDLRTEKWNRFLNNASVIIFLSVFCCLLCFVIFLATQCKMIGTISFIISVINLVYFLGKTICYYNAREKAWYAYDIYIDECINTIKETSFRRYGSLAKARESLIKLATVNAVRQ